ncbi:hypothetical protein BS47DRAFT_49631 [Hydnum rufescens UP504]|uniref:Uncharacterized protein n=1 Tax=Hydnum rufescens UP504 TaxID=1448309 RepID=A0A9P6ARF5_9AGAM|nr:hypothetical protein BS47DRAFT_49631 [Hydnum rufescens UP504]
MAMNTFKEFRPSTLMFYMMVTPLMLIILRRDMTPLLQEFLSCHYNPQDENSASREFTGGSPSRPLHPGSDQSSQSEERGHWFFAGCQPYIIAYTVTTVFLAAFYLVLIGLWSHHLFDHTLFNIARLGQVNQFVSVLSQAWAVATISVIAFTVQAIASDVAIQQYQTVAALHDTLGSWLGVMYAAVALFRSQDHHRTRLRLFLTLVFFASISILHISTPSVITVHAVNSTVPFNASVLKMPGNLSYIRVSDQTLNNLRFILPLIPYLWGQRNSGVGLPMGYNGTTLFSTLATPTQGDVSFEDPYAQNTAVQCGSVADRSHHIFNITLASSAYNPVEMVYDPGSGPYPNFLGLDLQLMVSISQNTTMKFRSSVAMAHGVVFASGIDYSFGGEAASLDAPPDYWMNDALVYLPWDQSKATQTSNDMGTTAFAYVSLRPDAFRTSSVGGDIPVIIERRQFKVWTWIGGSSAPVSAKQHDLNITFYIWPIICSLSVHNVTAWVRVRGETRLERTNASAALANLTTPRIKSIVSSDPMVTSWSFIMDLLFSLQQLEVHDTWTPVEQIFNQTWSLTSLEDQLSHFSAFYYSVLVQYWRSATLKGDLTPSQWWSEATGSVIANQLTLFGRLDLSMSQVIVGCVCIIALIVTSAISILGVRIEQGALMDGGVMNMITLLRGSSLPQIIAGDSDEDLGKDGRRRRAERTMVMYKHSILDVPERLEGAIFPHNSGDDKTGG